MARHAQLKCVMTECSNTQIRLTGLICYLIFKIVAAHIMPNLLPNSVEKIVYLPSNWIYKFSPKFILSGQNQHINLNLSSLDFLVILEFLLICCLNEMGARAEIKLPNLSTSRWYLNLSDLSLVTRKPVFGVCDQIRPKPAYIDWLEASNFLYRN